MEFHEDIFVLSMSKFPFVTIEYASPSAPVVVVVLLVGVELIFNQSVSVELIKRVASFAIEIFALRNQFLGDV
jgi:hypothetical protein